MAAKRRTAIMLMLILVFACGESNDPPPVPTVVALFDGVIAGNDGVEAGTLSLEFLSDGSGSGVFKPVGGVATILASVTATTSGFTTSGGGYSFAGTFTSSTLDGSYTSPGGGGVAAALRRAVGITITRYCGTHTGTDTTGVNLDGPYVVVWDGTALRGAWTSGVGSAFKGIVSGAEGNNAATMTGFPGPTTVLLNAGSGAMSGFYQLDNGSGGGMSGGACS